MPKVTEAQLIASMCRRSYSCFVREFWDVIVKEPLVWNWHIQLGCDEVQTCYERVFRWLPKEYDLLTNQPPGTSKSIVHSIMPCAWAWTRMPHLRFLGASYSSALSEKLSMYARDVVKSEKYQACFPEVKIRADKDNVGHFMTTAGGERYATSVGGSATGLIHAHVIVIDDPLNPEQALSEAEVFAANHWMTHTLLNRKVDKEVSFVDVVGQRICQGDPFEEFLRINPRVRHFVIPADTDYKIKPPELVSKYVGGLMDPRRHGRQSLDEEKAKGEHYYAGQFGQDPVPAGGGMFKTQLLRWGEPPNAWKAVARFWDKAGTGTLEAKRRTAYTSGVKMALDDWGRVWVLDVVRGRWDSHVRERVIRRTALRDGKVCVVGQEQEPGSGGKESAEGTTRRLAGFRVVTLVARGRKEVRAEEFSVAVNAGNVWLPVHLRQGNDWTGWAKEFVDELRHWPFSTHKDQGDSAAGSYTLLMTATRRRTGPMRYADGSVVQARRKLVVDAARRRV